MIRSAVTVSLVPEVRGGPFVFWDDLPAACRRASELGFDGVEVFPPSPDVVDPEHLRRLLAEHNLKLAAVGTGAGWVKHKLHLVQPAADDRRKARDFIKSIIDFAGANGAPAIIGSMQGRWGDGVDRDTAFGHLRDALGELGELAAGHGVPLLFEPINRYETNMVTTLGVGAELVRTTRNVRLLADLFHMNIEEADIAASLREAGPLVGHVHFVDSNRRPAGLGHIDYAPIFDALWATGYQGFCSAEALAYPDPDTAAKQTIATFNKYAR